MFTMLMTLMAANAFLSPIAAQLRLKREAENGTLHVERVRVALTEETIAELKKKGAYEVLLRAVQREQDLQMVGVP